MEFLYLMIAAFISLVGMLFHGIVGQKIYMGNIYKSDLEALTQSLSLVSWHIFTIFLFISFATCILVAFNSGLSIMLYPVIGINLLGSLMFLVLGITGHRALLKLPGAYLMGFTALFAYISL
jgi:hypothetical protein